MWTVFSRVLPAILVNRILAPGRIGRLALLGGIILATISSVGCTDGPDGRAESSPTGREAVTDSTLIEVLADLHLTGARRFLSLRNNSSRTAPEDTTDQLIRRLETGAPVDSLLTAHGVSRAKYESAIDWYVDHPEEFVNLYNRVLDRLNQVE